MSIIFLDRRDELNRLKEISSRNRAALIRMLGDRLLGKTELLIQLASQISGGKTVYYYQCTEISSKIQLEQIQNELKELLGDKTIVFQTWEHLFTYIMAKNDLFCIFDEFPYLVKAEEGIPTVLQKVWDHSHRTSTSKILLCGSLVSVMEELTSTGKPLYNRFTNTFRIDPLNFLQTRLFIPNVDFEQQFLLYAVFGGVPGFLVKIQDHYASGLENVLLNVVFAKDSPFQEPFPNVVRTQADLRNRERYNSILWAISNGKNTYSEINNAARFDGRANMTRYLNTLERLNVIKRVKPFLAKKPTRYEICDPFTHFWYKFYKRTLTPDNYIKNVVMPALPSKFLSFRFEDFCKELLQYLSIQGKFTDIFEDVHTFNDEYPDMNNQKQNLELDIVALGQTKNTLILGECKWHTNPPEIADLRHFANKCQIFFNLLEKKYKVKSEFDAFNKVEYVVFSRREANFPRGVPKNLQHIQIVSLNDLEPWVNLPENPPNKIL